MTVFAQEEKNNNNTQQLHFLSPWLGLCPKRNNNQTHQDNVWCREERLNNHVFTGPGIVELSSKNGIYCYTGNLTELTLIGLKFSLRDKEECFCLERTFLGGPEGSCNAWKHLYTASKTLPAHCSRPRTSKKTTKLIIYPNREGRLVCFTNSVNLMSTGNM